MTLHILDFIMYIVLVIILWNLLDLISGGELTEELGSLAGLGIILVFTAIYVIMFVFCGWDWTDIFAGNYESWIKFKL
jgi:hypothetical protein